MPGYFRPRIVGVSESDLQEFICGICHSVFIKPTFTECCGQTYCYECITEWVSENASCPYDRQRLSKDQLKCSPKMVINLLNKIKIKCEFYYNGCVSIISIGDLDDHQSHCLYNPDLKCEKCGLAQINHSDKVCSDRVFKKFTELSLYTKTIEKERDDLRKEYDGLIITKNKWKGSQNSNVRPWSGWKARESVNLSSHQFNFANTAMVDKLLDRGIITERVSKAMKAIDRANYCPTNPYSDMPQDCVFGILEVDTSTPDVHAKILEYIKDRLKYSTKVLDIGSGTGYLTACIAYLVGVIPIGSTDGKPGKVIGIEKVKEAVEIAKNSVLKELLHRIPYEGRINFHVGDGREGFEEEAPYDLIHVGAVCETIPQKLIDQLKPGGILIFPIETACPYGQVIKQVELMLDGSIKINNIPLLDFSYSSKLE